MNDPRVVIALDYSTADVALEFARRVSPEACRLKVGKQLFTAAGPRLVASLVEGGFSVFLDLKFHDIPNTVAAACAAAAELGVWMLNVHALGGRTMLSAARDAIDACAKPPKLVAVTLLTSLGSGDLRELGIQGDPASVALRMAKLAHEVGLDGVVCSAREATLLRGEFGPAFCLVTPGIRGTHVANDDQNRVMTPAAAIAAGADYLVIGRPITQAADPAAVLDVINAEIALAAQTVGAVETDPVQHER